HAPLFTAPYLPLPFSLFVRPSLPLFFFFFFNDTAPTEIYTLSLHDALPIYDVVPLHGERLDRAMDRGDDADCQGVLVAEWAADRRDRLAHDDRARVAERDRPQHVLRGSHPDQADVVVDVPADDGRRHAAAIVELA